MEGAEEKQGDPPSLKRRLYTLTNVNVRKREKRDGVWVSSEAKADIVVSENHEVVEVRPKQKEIPQEVQEVMEEILSLIHI